MHEDQKPITEYTLEELLPALNTALAAFEKDYYSPVKAAQARARKAKPDIVAEIHGRRYIADLKTTDSANPESIRKSIAKWGYHRQAAWYLSGMEAIGKPCDAFIFIFVDKKAPYLVTMCTLDEEALAQGMQECLRAVEHLKECQASNTWPCYTREIITLGLPKWAAA